MARKILPISMLRAARMNKYGKLLVAFKREVRKFTRIDSYYETWCLFEKLDYVYRNLRVFYRELPETQKEEDEANIYLRETRAKDVL